MLAEAYIKLDEELEHGLIMIMYNDAVMVQHAERMGKEFRRLDGALHVWESFRVILDQVYTENPFRGQLMWKRFKKVAR